MVDTEFIVRCSGRIEYAAAIIAAIMLAYAAFTLRNWISFPLDTVLLLIGALAAFSIIVSFVKAKIQYIDVDSEGVTLQLGLFNKKTTYVPYERITNIHVNRSILERVFMLGTLQIATAGTNAIEINMHNVPSHYLNKVAKKVSKGIWKGGRKDGEI